MAQVSGGNLGGLRMDQLNFRDLRDGDITSATSNSVVVNLGDGYIDTIAGTNFTFNGETPTGGTITRFSETLNGGLTFDFSGISLSVPTFFGWVQADDIQSAYSAGLSGQDDLTGTTFADYLDGYAGHDNLYGGAGSDTLLGSGGNDHLYGQSASGGADGADSLSGGEGSDYLQGNAGTDTLDGGAGSDRMFGGDDADQIFGQAGNDSVNGNLGNDSIDGGDGNDSLRGGQNDDVLRGGSGDDKLLGDQGNDALVGGTGLDELSGGAGSDVFRFAAGEAGFSATNGYSGDFITDFADGADRVALGFGVSAVLTGAAQTSAAAAASLAQTLFDGNAGGNEVAAITVGSDTYLFWNGTGGGSVDSGVRLNGVDSAVIGTADFT